MQWSPCNTCVSDDGTSLGFISHLGSRRGTFYNNLYGEAPPERGGTFFRLQVYERVGILPFEVYQRVGKSVIWVC